MSARPQILASRRRWHRAAIAALVVSLAVALPPTSSGDVDTTPPTMIFLGEVNDGPVVLDHLALLFDEVLDPTSIPDASDFGFHVLPEGPVSTPTPADVPATDVAFVFSGLVGLEIFPNGTTLLRLELGTTYLQADTVYLTYTPGSRPLRDLAGNEVAAFSNAGGALFNGIPGEEFFIDDGLGPNRLLYIANPPRDIAEFAAADFSIQVNGTSTYVATGIEQKAPGFGMSFIVLDLPVDVAAGDEVRASIVGGVTGRLVSVTLPATPSRSTPTGSGVVVSPRDETTGAATTTITFDAVSVAGATTVESSGTGPAVPAGLSFGDPPVYYDITTTATFTSAEVCIAYDPLAVAPPESALRLLHFEGGTWVDVTLPGYPDTVNHVICGTVTSFSPFAVAAIEPTDFTGFFAPVDNAPTRNRVKAGAAVPVKFSLGGDHGLEIFAAGSPASQAIACDSGVPIDMIEQTASPGSATLSYDPGADRYTYVWKTSKGWSGCRQLTVTFREGTTGTAIFEFR